MSMKNEYRRLSQFCDRVSYLTTNWIRQQIEEDFTKLDSLHYNFTLIGEATNRILKNDQEVATQLRARILRIRDVVEFRNALSMTMMKLVLMKFGRL